jgi:hypothetical protein
MLSRLLFWLSGELPCRIISDDIGSPYLERYYLFTYFGVRFYLHRFVASDPDRGLHDHPWPWAASVVLSGYYFEETRKGIRRVRWLNGLVGDSFHRVILPTLRGDPAVGQDQRGCACWTLFFHRAAYIKPWGFLRHLSSEGTEKKGDSARIWVPYNYPGDGTGTNDPWWKNVAQGKFEKRRRSM